jgi:hypothetical protein
MQGLKRAADGSVKGSDTINEPPVVPTMGHKRNKSSMESGRIGQVRQNHLVLGGCPDTDHLNLRTYIVPRILCCDDETSLELLPD